MSELPDSLTEDFAKAKKLEWWTLGWMSTIVVIMYFTMGASQAMKTAFFEDILGVIPAITFLVAAHLETREPTKRFPFGYLRANTLAFFASAVVLCFMGAFLIWKNGMGLMKGEHPTIGPVTIAGETFWLGWLMIGALSYSIIPPVILGRMKQPVAKRLRDKVLHTDSLMQKADWQTGVAGIAGILGIGFGLWWADSLAALLIALSIAMDGINATRSAAAELLDGTPRKMKGNGISQEAEDLKERLQKTWPDGTVRLRESGRYIFASVDGVDHPGNLPSDATLMGDHPSWRLGRLSFTPPRKVEL